MHPQYQFGTCEYYTSRRRREATEDLEGGSVLLSISILRFRINERMNWSLHTIHANLKGRMCNEGRFVFVSGVHLEALHPQSVRYVTRKPIIFQRDSVVRLRSEPWFA
jgi:hypothetical protein